MFTSMRASRTMMFRSPKVGSRLLSTVYAPLGDFTEEEQMFKDMVTAFSQQEIAPKVKEMDGRSWFYQRVWSGKILS